MEPSRQCGSQGNRLWRTAVPRRSWTHWTRSCPTPIWLSFSGTPGEALQREWDENAIAHYPKIIAGQELGKKTEHLQTIAGGDRYAAEKRLMIGDAPGDRKAAEATGVLVLPGQYGSRGGILGASAQRGSGAILRRFFRGGLPSPTGCRIRSSPSRATSVGLIEVRRDTVRPGRKLHAVRFNAPTLRS